MSDPGPDPLIILLHTAAASESTPADATISSVTSMNNDADMMTSVER